MRITEVSVALCALLALGACGGGGGGGSASSANNIVRSSNAGVLATDNRTLRELFENTNTVFSPVSTGLSVDGANRELSSSGSVSALSQSANGNINVTYTVDGADQTVVFRPQDQDPDFGDFERTVGNQNFIIQETFVPNTTLDYVGFLVGGRADQNSRGFVTVGAIGPRTPVSELPMTNARYNGSANAFVANDPSATGVLAENIDADFTMLANFETGKVAGRLDNFTAENTDSSTSSLAGLIRMRGDISGNAFDGTLVGEDAVAGSAIDNLEGAFAGNFYGPDADEVGGVINGTTTDAKFIGGFGGSR